MTHITCNLVQCRGQRYAAPRQPPPPCSRRLGRGLTVQVGRDAAERFADGEERWGEWWRGATASSCRRWMQLLLDKHTDTRAACSMLYRYPAAVRERRHTSRASMPSSAHDIRPFGSTSYATPLLGCCRRASTHRTGWFRPSVLGRSDIGARPPRRGEMNNPTATRCDAPCK